MNGWTDTTPYAAWARAGFDTWTLGLEATAVVGLRLAKLAVGGAAANREAHLMISEKLGSIFELQMKMMTGGLGLTPLSGTQATILHYRGKVRANRRRLS